MHRFNFAIKHLIIVLIGINYFSCSKKDAPIIDGVFHYISDSLVNTSCCDSILIASDFKINFNDKMMYLPNIFLSALKIDTNILKNQKIVVINNKNDILAFFKNRSHKSIYTNTIPFHEFPITRPAPHQKLTLVISDIFYDRKDKGVIFVSLLTSNTNTFMLVLQKKDKHFYVEKAILLDGFFPWI